MRLVLLILVCFTLSINNAQAQTDTTTKTLQAERVEVRARRMQYRKRGNPAAELAARLVSVRDKGDPFKATNLTYTRHEKIVLSIDNFKPLDSTSKLSFLNQNVIVNPITGRRILPVSLKERIVATNSKNGVASEKELLKNTFGIDENLDSQSISAYLSTTMESTNIFADYIHFVQRRFVSPISRTGLDFYKYYLDKDTILVNGARCVRLGFFPFNKDGLGLNGSLFVRADSSLFVERADITMPRTADVNYVNNLSVTINYRLDSLGYRLLEKEVLNFGFSLTEKSSAFHAQRTNDYVNYEFLSHNNPAIERPSVHVSMIDSVEIERIQSSSTTIRRRPLFLIGEQLTILASQGYLGTGRKSKFDIGPILNFLSGNELEGTRIRVGGMTTPNLLKRIFFEGYVAYGTRDERWKYSAAIEWSFINRAEHLREFPVHSLRLSYTDDVYKFGQPFGSLSTENVFSWLKRATDNSLTYMRRAELTYMREFKSRFSYNLTARHYTESESSVMHFAPNLREYTMSELQLHLRYSPGEVIFQTKKRRYNMQKYSPTISLSHTAAFSGVLGSNYNNQRTELSVSNRFNIQPLGYIDARINLGAQWSKVPYMLLPHPPTNLSYVIREGSFSLMQPLEMLYDRYLQWDVSYYLDGLLLSRIPLIKKLKLREVVTCRGVWGTLTDKNNPNINTTQVPFPTHSRPIGSQPYIEVSVGVENILNIFRIDYVWRVTHLNGGRSIRGGVMIDARFKF